VLAEYRCPAVVFVPTDHVGGFNDFDHGRTREPLEKLCGWDELRRLGSAGLSVQSQGASHRPFSQLSPAELSSEVMRSKAEMEQHLERPVRLLAYPYGDLGSDTDLTADVLAQAGYEAAFTYGGGPFDPWQADRFRLDRIAVGPGTSLSNI
jgi:peptidoglycan/xylan/chitin deacetylase (PgdA/CDA1 family)